ncbi:DUF5059 domain-containing protein [Halorientalis litorea]|uniref:DUF5059 domain-containing protein n=1 Tax=Halorientalis litorea TaxID=2931977 RepID=UPI001FF40F5B|nr:DUF5059 domain-containing protein [Halorientalis litorea]
MEQTRRNWLRTASAAVAGVALSGCAALNGGENGGASTQVDASATDIGVVSEWNAIRTRLRDPVILGHAGEFAAGATVVGDIFERFETASGQHNAHEALEETSEESYEGFEDALGTLRTELEAENLDGAHDAMKTADGHLKEAQTAKTNEQTVKQLSMLVMGTHAEDAALLVALGVDDDAEHEMSKIGDKFEEKHYEMVAEVDEAAADQFVDAMDRAAENVGADSEASISAAHEAFGAATQGLHALAGDSVAGAGHMAALQARGWDGAALGRLGGPSQSYAHAAALNDYRATARDAQWLYEAGNEAAAGALVQRALGRFETASAHDPLEEANHDAYESFEGGLETLSGAIENGEDAGVTEAVGTVEDGVRSGITALASDDQSALLEAGYTKTRIEDAYERYQRGAPGRAAEIAQNVFADFEADASGFHETLEETDGELYETFEDEHLTALIEAFQNENDEAATTHVEGIRDTLLSFETALGSRPVVSGVESGYITARLRDAVVLDQLGATERAQTVATEAFGHFEAGAGGFHEAIEEADHETYEAFEGAVESLQNSLGTDGATDALETATARATDAGYAVVAAGSGGSGGTQFVQNVFAHFENAAVHDMLEAADTDAYESYEAALDSYVETLDSGGDVQTAAGQYADATLQAQFAVAGAPDEAPVEANAESGQGTTETELEGGPNVVEGVPDDADHVVDMTAVAFEPEEITISQGDTVAWKHVGGEAHNVVAYEDEIPADADYWASGGFGSEEAAREGWENGEGAVQSGEAYVKTFETTGTHGYFCTPHEAAGMVGTVVVE